MPRSAWDLVLERKTPLHVHPCPICYQHTQCSMDCTIEPDLELMDGTPSGSHICCSEACARENDEILDEAYGPGARRGRTSFLPPREVPAEPVMPEVPEEQLAFVFTGRAEALRVSALQAGRKA